MKKHIFLTAFCAITAMAGIMVAWAKGLEPTETESVLIVKLVNQNGGVFSNISVTITDMSHKKIASGKSNSEGIYEALVPVNARYNVEVANYPEMQVVKIPEGGFSKKTIKLIYEADAVQKQKEWEMSATEKAQLDKWASTLPDNTFFNETAQAKLKPGDYYVLYTMTLSQNGKKPLDGERLLIHGQKRNKNFVASSNLSGQVRMVLPKGDTYTLNFTFDSMVSTFEIPYSMGDATKDFTMDYIGTKEILRIRKEEAERVALEEIRLKKEREAFEAKCKSLGITVEEGRRRELMGWNNNMTDTVVLKVFRRNQQWKDKLIVCDLTGSMSPYTTQLLIWYTMNLKREKNLQFVFFNDGDNKDDSKKVIGSTGGIYYQNQCSYDSLVKTMSRVSAAGGGGDCPENNMEALIKGTKMSKPFKDLIMIADNNAPVKDISLLQQFHTPVHIVVCGSGGTIHPDYLQIAYKTGGSVHTMEEDITNLAKLMDGEVIHIGHYSYRLQNGKFYVVSNT